MDRKTELAELRKKYPLVGRKQLEGMVDRRQRIRKAQQKGKINHGQAKAGLAGNSEDLMGMQLHRQKAMKQKVIPARELRKIEIDLDSFVKPIESSGATFSVDDMNSMMSATKTMKDFFTRQDMLDSSGRSPIDEGYGTLKGVGMDFKQTLGRRNSPAEQVSLLMQQDPYMTNVDQYNPMVKKVFKNNPKLALEYMNRMDRFRRNNRTDDGLGSEREFANPNSPLDQAFLDLRLKQSDARADIALRDKDKTPAIEKLQKRFAPKKLEDPEAPIDPKTGKRFETIKEMDQRLARKAIKDKALAAAKAERIRKGKTKSKSLRKRIQMGGQRESWEKYLQKGGIAKNSPLPGDIVDAKLEPGEYVLNRNAVNAIGKETLDKINNKIAPRFSNKYQEGGNVMTREDYINQAENLGEQTFEKAGQFARNIYGGAKDLLKGAYDRFGGEAYRASKTKNLMAEMDMNNTFDDRDMDASVADELDASNLEMAKMLRDEFGAGEGDLAMAYGQGKQRLKDDIETGVGALVGGAGMMGRALQNTYAGAKDRFQDFKKNTHAYLSDDSGYEEDFSKVLSGEAKGSNMQRVGKSASFLGSMFDQLASFQGFGEGADMGKYSRQKKLTDVQVDTANENKPMPENDVLQANYDEALEKARIMKEKGYELPESLLEAEANQIGPRKKDGSFQLGGHINMDGFIQQAFRNVYGN